jgi:CheY-like chemotaxis protein
MEDQRFVAMELLRKGRFFCDEASNWKDALQKIRTNKFSLVVLDVEMPEIDGYELLEIIRREKTDAELPVIMLSSKEMDVGRCKKLGVVCFISKEHAIDDLVPFVRKTLGIV